MWSCSDKKFIFNNQSSSEFLLATASKTSTVIGLEDSSRKKREDSLFLSVFDGSTLGLQGAGLQTFKGEFIVTTNVINREERVSDRCVFIPMVPWDHLVSTKDKLALTERY